MIKHKAWGIGLSRTGCTSLYQALKILGYSQIKQNPIFEDLKNLDAATDIGCALFYKYLDYKFPNSKFILTTRSLDHWLDSMESVLEAYPTGRKNDIAIQRRMMLYETVTFDRVKLTDAYNRHYEDVNRYFLNKQESLLKINLTEQTDNWEQISSFLTLKKPEINFPHLNAKAQMIEKAEIHKKQQQATEKTSYLQSIKQYLKK